MFENYFGYKKVASKVSSLLGEILKGASDSLKFVRVLDERLIVTNNEQILRIDIDDPSQAPDDGLFVMAGSIFVPVLNKAIRDNFPDVDPLLDYGNFTKTATLHVPPDAPMVALSYLIQEFSVTLPLDTLSSQLKRLFSFKPEYIRAFGQENPDRAKHSPVKIEMIFNEDKSNFSVPVAVEFLTMPLTTKKEDYVQVDEQPMLFDIKNAG